MSLQIDDKFADYHIDYDRALCGVSSVIAGVIGKYVRSAFNKATSPTIGEGGKKLSDIESSIASLSSLEEINLHYRNEGIPQDTRVKCRILAYDLHIRLYGSPECRMDKNTYNVADFTPAELQFLASSSPVNIADFRPPEINLVQEKRPKPSFAESNIAYEDEDEDQHDVRYAKKGRRVPSPSRAGPPINADYKCDDDENHGNNIRPQFSNPQITYLSMQEMMSAAPSGSAIDDLDRKLRCIVQPADITAMGIECLRGVFLSTSNFREFSYTLQNMIAAQQKSSAEIKAYECKLKAEAAQIQAEFTAEIERKNEESAATTAAKADAIKAEGIAKVEAIAKEAQLNREFRRQVLQAELDAKLKALREATANTEHNRSVPPAPAAEPRVNPPVPVGHDLEEQHEQQGTEEQEPEKQQKKQQPEPEEQQPEPEEQQTKLKKRQLDPEEQQSEEKQQTKLKKRQLEPEEQQSEGQQDPEEQLMLPAAAALAAALAAADAKQQKERATSAVATHEAKRAAAAALEQTNSVAAVSVVSQGTENNEGNKHTDDQKVDRDTDEDTDTDDDRGGTDIFSVFARVSEGEDAQHVPSQPSSEDGAGGHVLTTRNDDRERTLQEAAAHQRARDIGELTMRILKFKSTNENLRAPRLVRNTKTNILMTDTVLSFADICKCGAINGVSHTFELADRHQFPYESFALPRPSTGLDRGVPMFYYIAAHRFRNCNGGRFRVNIFARNVRASVNPVIHE